MMRTARAAASKAIKRIADIVDEGDEEHDESNLEEGGVGATLRPAKKRRLQENDPDVSPPSDTSEGDDDHDDYDDYDDDDDDQCRRGQRRKKTDAERAGEKIILDFMGTDYRSFGTLLSCTRRLRSIIGDAHTDERVLSRLLRSFQTRLGSEEERATNSVHAHAAFATLQPPTEAAVRVLGPLGAVRGGVFAKFMTHIRALLAFCVATQMAQAVEIGRGLAEAAPGVRSREASKQRRAFEAIGLDPNHVLMRLAEANFPTVDEENAEILRTTLLRINGLSEDARLRCGLKMVLALDATLGPAGPVLPSTGCRADIHNRTLYDGQPAAPKGAADMGLQHGLVFVEVLLAGNKNGPLDRYVVSTGASSMEESDPPYLAIRDPVSCGVMLNVTHRDQRWARGHPSAVIAALREMLDNGDTRLGRAHAQLGGEKGEMRLVAFHQSAGGSARLHPLGQEGPRTSRKPFLWYDAYMNTNRSFECPLDLEENLVPKYACPGHVRTRRHHGIDLPPSDSRVSRVSRVTFVATSTPPRGKTPRASVTGASRSGSGRTCWK